MLTEFTPAIQSFRSADLAGTWHDKKKGWGHALHKLAPYVGGFPPRLANFFITRFSEPGQVVFDPFSGGGTAPLEACVRGRVGVGNDAFSYAHVLTRAKVDPPTRASFLDYFHSLTRRVEAHGEVQLDDEDVRVFYHPRTLADLLRYREVLSGEPDSPEVNFTRALFCAILHGPSPMFLSWPMKETCSSTVGYITRYFHEHGVKPRYKAIPERVLAKTERAYAHGLPAARGRAYMSDSRSLPLPDESVDFVLTSPPYMRVLDYTWNNWLRLWFLGEDRKDARAKLVLTASEGKWVAFMRDTLREIYRVLVPDSWCVFVVGDVKKKERVLNSAGILAGISAEVGFTPWAIINDDYTTKNRTLLVYNDLKYDSFDRLKDPGKLVMPMDRCLVLAKGHHSTDPSSLGVVLGAPRARI
ncbi:MAG: DNA methyltransferase [Promethearchaeota archaeon]